MEFGDNRLPERFWKKVNPEHESGCWIWTAAIKRRKGGTRGYATFAMDGKSLSMITVVGEIVFPDYNKNTHRIVNTCENKYICALHVAVEPRRSACKNGHENPERDSRYNCILCKKENDKKRPPREGMRGTRRKKQKMPEGYTVFGDREIDDREIWRPPGWSKEVLGGKLSA